MNREQLDLLLAISTEAAQLISAVYRTEFRVDYKAPRDPVTDADRQANALICRRLGQEFPGVPVVAEESLPESFANFAASDRIFFVDPLDGTREFVEKNGEFVVMIGLVEGQHATVGVIHAPELGIAWVGARGQGAVSVDRNGVRQPLRVSSVFQLTAAHIVSSRSHRSTELEGVLSHLGAAKVSALGSAGLKGAEVARGAADAYVAPHYAGKRWDACAADALIASAGGLLTDASGIPINYRSPELENDTGIVATNGLLHPLILERLAELEARKNPGKS